MLDLGPRARVALCVVFFASEAALIATAGTRSDRSFGFRMFPESSRVVVHLSRRLDGDRLVPVEGERWRARDCSGQPHDFAWRQMVRIREGGAPTRLDVLQGAPYGVDSAVARTRDAVDWVAAHTPDDCETRALVARVEEHRNGRDPVAVEVEAVRAR